MKNIQELLNLLAPITGIIATIALLLDNIIKLSKSLKEILIGLRPGFKILLLLMIHILPVGGVIWYFMYYAAIYSERLIEKEFFLLIITYPTLLISLYEIFLGIRIYPKLFSAASPAVSSLNDTRHKKNKRR